MHRPTTGANPIDIVYPGIALGNVHGAQDVQGLAQRGVTHILNAASLKCPCFFPQNFSYKAMPLTDTPSQNIMQFFTETSKFIHDVRASGRTVFVHCVEGKSRSSTLVIAYLMDTERLGLQEALRMVQAARPVAMPNEGFMLQLQHYESLLKPHIQAGAGTPQRRPMPQQPQHQPQPHQHPPQHQPQPQPPQQPQLQQQQGHYSASEYNGSGPGMQMRVAPTSNRGMYSTPTQQQETGIARIQREGYQEVRNVPQQNPYDAGMEAMASPRQMLSPRGAAPQPVVLPFRQPGNMYEAEDSPRAIERRQRAQAQRNQFAAFASKQTMESPAPQIRQPWSTHSQRTQGADDAEVLDMNLLRGAHELLHDDEAHAPQEEVGAVKHLGVVGKPGIVGKELIC